jgi:hypothetical protein
MQGREGLNVIADCGFVVGYPFALLVGWVLKGAPAASRPATRCCDWILCGCSRRNGHLYSGWGGGYLMGVANEPVPGAFKVNVRAAR